MPGFRDPNRFRQSRIPGLARPQSWDFGITKIEKLAKIVHFRVLNDTITYVGYYIVGV